MSDVDLEHPFMLPFEPYDLLLKALKRLSNKLAAFSHLITVPWFGTKQEVELFPGLQLMLMMGATAVAPIASTEHRIGAAGWMNTDPSGLCLLDAFAAIRFSSH